MNVCCYSADEALQLHHQPKSDHQWLEHGVHILQTLSGKIQASF